MLGLEHQVKKWVILSAAKDLGPLAAMAWRQANPEGIQANSRWLSEARATPPVSRQNVAPRGGQIGDASVLGSLQNTEVHS
jgi:hypothetical protein